jgi:hypothetical protein
MIFPLFFFAEVMVADLLEVWTTVRDEEPFATFLWRAFAADFLVGFVIARALVVSCEELLGILATVLALPFFEEAERTGLASRCWVKQRMTSRSGICNPRAYRHFFPIACFLLFWRRDER